MQVMSSGNCTAPQDGVARVTLAEVAKLRGGTLLTSPPEESGAVYVSVAKKNQRTGGYALTLQGARREADRAEVALLWKSPAKGDMTIQQITHPCVVIGFDGTGLSRVNVSDQNGLIGSLALE